MKGGDYDNSNDTDIDIDERTSDIDEDGFLRLDTPKTDDDFIDPHTGKTWENSEEEWRKEPSRIQKFKNRVYDRLINSMSSSAHSRQFNQSVKNRKWRV